MASLLEGEGGGGEVILSSSGRYGISVGGRGV